MFRVCRVFRVVGVDDMLEGGKGDQGGGQKLAKIQYRVKPDIFKYANRTSSNVPNIPKF